MWGTVNSSDRFPFSTGDRHDPEDSEAPRPDFRSRPWAPFNTEAAIAADAACRTYRGHGPSQEHGAERPQGRALNHARLHAAKKRPPKRNNSRKNHRDLPKRTCPSGGKWKRAVLRGLEDSPRRGWSRQRRALGGDRSGRRSGRGHAHRGQCLPGGGCDPRWRTGGRRVQLKGQQRADRSTAQPAPLPERPLLIVLHEDGSECIAFDGAASPGRNLIYMDSLNG